MSFQTEDLGRFTLLLVMHTAASPPLAAWEGFEAYAREQKRRVEGDLQRIRSLVISDGGAPSTGQRHTLHNEIWEDQPVKTALLTNSLENPIKRGIATALTWMNAGFKICAPDDLRGALVHLDLEFGFERVWETCGLLQARMPLVATLAGVADTLKRPRWPGSVTLREAELRS